MARLTNEVLLFRVLFESSRRVVVKGNEFRERFRTAVNCGRFLAPLNVES
ncbi:unnamed protein product [Victoria cruziana]